MISKALNTYKNFNARNKLKIFKFKPMDIIYIHKGKLKNNISKIYFINKKKNKNIIINYSIHKLKIISTHSSNSCLL